MRAIQSQLSTVEYRNGQICYRAIFVFDHEYYRLRYRLRTAISSNIETMLRINGRIMIIVDHLYKSVKIC